ncbi:MAG: hypothetical protein ACE5LU_18005 [Anaerolineae bacterium]
MSTEEQMTIDERYKYLRLMQPRYFKADHQARSALLLEIDLVHHCGVSTEGEYAHSLQMVDVATGWRERVAVLGRSYLVMSDAFRYTSRRGRY